MTNFEHVLAAAAIGIAATLLMDFWNFLLLRVFRLPSLNYCLLGRWIRHMPAGTFRHASIATAAPRPGECATGWISHYTIGIAFALAFVALADGWLAQPTPGPALLFGIATVAFPFFLLQPALGLGVASSRAARPMQARMKSLGTHTVFGIGLYLGGSLLVWLQRIA